MTHPSAVSWAAVCLEIAAICLFPVTETASAHPPQILWWHDLNAPSFGGAAVGDIDQDGRPEIVFGTYFNDERICALNGEDGSAL